MELFNSSLMVPPAGVLPDGTNVDAAAFLSALGLTPSDASAVAASLAKVAATRAPLAGLAYSDGATGNRRIEWTMGAAGNVAGSALSEVGHVFRVPTSNPSANAVLFSASSSTSYYYNVAWSYGASILTDGRLRIEAKGADYVADNRKFDYPGFRAAYSGKIIRLDVVLTSGTTSPTVYINGVDVSSSFTLTTTGIPPDWMSTSLVATYRVCGLYWPAGEFTSGTPLNRALSATEIATMVQTNALLPYDRAGGSVVSLLSGNDSTFASSLGSWTTESGATADATTVPGKAFVTLGGSGYSTFSRGSTLSVGRRYGFSLKARLASGTLPTGGLQFGIGTGSTVAAFSPTGTEQTFTGEFTVGSTQTLRIGSSASNSAAFEFDDILVWPIGALIQPIPNGTALVPDVGPNRIHGTCTSGVRTFSAENDLGWVEHTLTTSGAYLTRASTNPLVYENAMIVEAWAMADTAGADITWRNNSSSTNDIVTAATDIPVANQWQQLTTIQAQRALAANTTDWGSSSAGTIRLRRRLARV